MTFDLFTLAAMGTDFLWDSAGHLIIPANGDPGIPLPFGLKIRFYALSYLMGLFGAWWYVKRLLGAPNPPMSPQHADDFLLWGMLGVVLGGRVGHILFYDPEGKYLAAPLEMLKVWEGGMSFHGGVMGVTVAIILFAWKHKLKWLRLHDYIACGVPIGLFTGRVANFLNGELWGAETSAPWGVVFAGANNSLKIGAPDLPRHPSQLYEAGLEGLLLFGILYFLFWKTDARKKPGLLVGMFILGYGVFRFLIEFVRIADANLMGKTGALHMGQWLCVPMILGGLFLMLTANRRRIA
jgi:phosphatidylglycerol---prolipoprotein diacylglyceryl transferase